MRFVNNLPIQIKLTLLTMGIVVVALLLSSTVLVQSDIRMVKTFMTDHYLVLANVLGRDSRTALEFEIPQSAIDVLASLEAEPSVSFACTYDTDGKVMASYSASEQAPVAPVLHDPRVQHKPPGIAACEARPIPRWPTSDSRRDPLGQSGTRAIPGA